MARGRSLRDDERTREAERLKDALAQAPLSLLWMATEGPCVRPLPTKGSLVLGRAETCDVPIDDDLASRRHAVLHVDGDAVVIEDLGSMNGTRVVGAPLASGEKRGLHPGATFEIGATTVTLQRSSASLGASRGRAREGDVRADVIVRDATMQRLYRMIDVIAPSMLCVLVLGETGVGKEIFAETVHQRSARADRPFLRLNCAALPESILEGELFGYERGAFTGATQAKAGLFESADGGTVFLDEVGELSATTQAKLLRVLESGEVMRLGALKPKQVDVRFVSATNRDLEQRVAEGAFRADLYYRLNGIALTLPPLRERKEDILPLAESFVARAAAKMSKPPARLDGGARAALEAYRWPGNIRELRNVIERAVLLAAGDAIGAADLGLADAASVVTAPAAAPIAQRRPTADLGATTPPSPAPPSAQGLRAERDAFEKQRILDALEQCAGNQSRAAKLLGIGRRTLIEKLDAYGLPRPRKGRLDADD